MACLLSCFGGGSKKQKTDEAANAQTANGDDSMMLERKASLRVNIYIPGDDDDNGIQSLLSPTTSEGNDTYSLAAAGTHDAIKHRFKLALPRDLWAERVINETPRRPSSAGSTADPSSPSSSSDVPLLRSSSSNRSLSPQPIPLYREMRAAAAAENDIQPYSCEEEQEENVYWKMVAKNLMTFKLGIDPSTNEPLVMDSKNESVNSWLLKNTDNEIAFEKIKQRLGEWFVKSSQTRSRRSSFSGTANVQPSVPCDPRSSPKNLLSDNERDDELRTFIGESERGVPIMRCNILRCTEKSTVTDGVLLRGLIIFGVDVAEQMQPVHALYSQWVLEYIVTEGLKVFDFIRLADKFAAENYEAVVHELVAANVFDALKDRIIKYANVSLNMTLRSR